MPPTYLVTGGAGFIGSHIVAELLRRGESVRIADNFSTGRRENVPAGAVEVVEGELADAEIARRAVDGCTYVIHQAAIPSVPRSVKDPVASNRANVDATLQLLVAAPWPGNVRQLLNLLEQSLALTTTGVIPASQVQSALREDAAALIPFEEARKTFERDYLVRLLKITGGNVTQAAQLAKRNRTEFYKLLQRHRLEPAMFKESKH